jgi:hypothetical protein
MGISLNWLAVERADKAAVLERLGLVECGLAGDELNSGLACAVFPDGWLVLASAERGLDLDKALPLASPGGLALGCEVEERTMFSRLRAFRNGAQAWAVTHDPDVDPRDVAVEGEPPPLFGEVRQALAAEQAADEDEDEEDDEVDDDDEVDHMFDLPDRLGSRLCGYAWNEPSPVMWTILERAGRGRAGQTPTGLAQAFTSELLPLLQARGWTPAAAVPGFSGRVWDVGRVLEGRRQLLSFTWKDHGPDLQFETQFHVLEGDGWNDAARLFGEVRPVRSGEASAGPFWRRIAERFRTSGDAPPADRLASFIAGVKEDLAAADAFLTSGEPHARIRIRYGSLGG